MGSKNGSFLHHLHPKNPPRSINNYPNHPKITRKSSNHCQSLANLPWGAPGSPGVADLPWRPAGCSRVAAADDAGLRAQRRAAGAGGAEGGGGGAGGGGTAEGDRWGVGMGWWFLGWFSSRVLVESWIVSNWLDGFWMGKMTPTPGVAPGMASWRAIVAVSWWHLGPKDVVPGTLRRVAGRGLRAAHRGWIPGAAGRHQGPDRSWEPGWFFLGTIWNYGIFSSIRWIKMRQRHWD